MLSPILGGLMISYVDYSIFKDRERILKRKYYMHLSVVTLIVLIVNHFIPLYFHVNPETNRYSSGDFQFVHYIMIAGFYSYMLIFLYKNRKNTFPHVIRFFMTFFMLPVLGMLIQLINSRIHFSWTSMVLGCLVAYTFLESATSEHDFLTKLYNRQSYETYIQHLIETKKTFGVVLIDLNGFKEINDKYGHHEGDLVLVEFSKVLSKVFNKESLVSRLGGDEFMIVCNGNGVDMGQRMDMVYDFLKEHDNSNIKQLQFSYGFQMYHSNLSVDELYRSVDRKMYLKKSKM